MNLFRYHAAPRTGCMQGRSREFGQPADRLRSSTGLQASTRPARAATRRNGATARSRNTAGGRFPGLPARFEPEGVKQGFRRVCSAPAQRHWHASQCASCKDIAALQRLHRGPPWAARCPCRARTGLHADTATQASSMLLEFPASPLHCIPSGSNVTPKQVHNRL